MIPIPPQILIISENHNNEINNCIIQINVVQVQV